MIIYDTKTRLRRTYWKGALTWSLITYMLMLCQSWVWIERSKDTTNYIESMRHDYNSLFHEGNQ